MFSSVMTRYKFERFPTATAKFAMLVARLGRADIVCIIVVILWFQVVRDICCCNLRTGLCALAFVENSQLGSGCRVLRTCLCEVNQGSFATPQVWLAPKQLRGLCTCIVWDTQRSV